MKNIAIIFIAFSLFSCKGFDAYYKHDRFINVKESKYINDSIYFSNYILCSHQRKMAMVNLEFVDTDINQDSLIGMFISNFQQIDIKLLNSKGENLFEPKYCHKESLSLRHLRNYEFEKNGINSNNKKVLFPIVVVDDIYQFTGYMTSNQVAGDDGFMHNTSLKLIVLILENNKIIYSEKQRYVSKKTFANSLEEVKAIPPAYQVREEHIEELVRRAMKRYVKRLER